MRWLRLTFAIKTLRYLLRQLMYLDKRINKNFDKDSHDKLVIQSTRHYDMYAMQDERYYATQYWRWIEKFLIRNKINKNGLFLDAGCGHGRMTVPLAKWCGDKGSVVAVDFSEIAIKKAKQYAVEKQVNNVNFIVSDLLQYLESLDDQVFDGVILLEIVFFLPDYAKVLKEIKRVLKPGGFFIGSFRSQYFYLLHSLYNGLWGSVNEILEKRTGNIMGGTVTFNWHTLSELKLVLQENLCLSIDSIVGIGACSGIPGDPHDSIKPSMLTSKEKSLLMKAEEQVGLDVPACGRYMLIAGRVL